MPNAMLALRHGEYRNYYPVNEFDEPPQSTFSTHVFLVRLVGLSLEGLNNEIAPLAPNTGLHTVVALHKVGADGRWGWAQIEPGTKGVIGEDLMSMEDGWWWLVLSLNDPAEDDEEADADNPFRGVENSPDNPTSEPTPDGEIGDEFQGQTIADRIPRRMAEAVGNMTERLARSYAMEIDREDEEERLVLEVEPRERGNNVFGQILGILGVPNPMIDGNFTEFFNRAEELLEEREGPDSSNRPQED